MLLLLKKGVGGRGKIDLKKNNNGLGDKKALAGKTSRTNKVKERLRFKKGEKNKQRKENSSQWNCYVSSEAGPKWRGGRGLSHKV